MRNAAVQLCLLMIAITSVHAVKIMQSGSLQGKVYPANGAENVWAVKGNDSIKIRSSEGDFYITLDPGRWKVVINARSPFRSMLFDTLVVKRGGIVDLGKINLQKQEATNE